MQGDARVLRITYISKLFHFLKIWSVGRTQEKSDTAAKWREELSPKNICPTRRLPIDQNGLLARMPGEVCGG